MSSQNDQATASLSDWAAAEASGDTAVAIALHKAGGAYQGNEVPGDLRAPPCWSTRRQPGGWPAST